MPGTISSAVPVTFWGKKRGKIKLPQISEQSMVLFYGTFLLSAALGKYNAMRGPDALV